MRNIAGTRHNCPYECTAEAVSIGGRETDMADKGILMTTAILSVTAIGGSDGRRPLLMGAIAQAGIGYFYGHLDRWVALYDNRDLGKPIRLRDPRGDTFDDNGVVTREGRVDVLGRLQDARLALYYGRHVGRNIVASDDIARREEYAVDPRAFAHFAEACRLTHQNERALGRLVAEIAQQRRAVDPASMVVNLDL